MQSINPSPEPVGFEVLTTGEGLGLASLAALILVRICSALARKSAASWLVISSVGRFCKILLAKQTIGIYGNL